MSDATATAQPPDQPSPPRRRNWLKILLIVSVSINLLVAGAIVTRFVAVKRMIHEQGMGAPGLMLRQSRYMMRSLSRERKTELRGIVGPHRKILRRSRGEIGQRRADIARLMRAETLDKKALSTALKKLNVAEDKAHETVTRLREDFLLSLTASERQLYAKNLLKPRFRGGPRHGPRGKWDRR